MSMSFNIGMNLGFYPRLMSKIFRRRFYQHDIVCNGVIEPYTYVIPTCHDNEIMEAYTIYKGFALWSFQRLEFSPCFTDGYNIIPLRYFFMVSFDRINNRLKWGGYDHDRVIYFYKISRNKSVVLMRLIQARNSYEIIWSFKDSNCISVEVLTDFGEKVLNLKSWLTTMLL